MKNAHPHTLAQAVGRWLVHSFARPMATRLTAALSSLVVLLTLGACTGLMPRNDCPAAQDMTAEMLQGPWTVQVAGEAPWALHLGPHPEHTGSLHGELTQGPLRRAVVADLDDGEFTLEETHDGQRIAATWLGSLPAAGCGRLIQGQRLGPNQVSQPFAITRTP